MPAQTVRMSQPDRDVGRRRNSGLQGMPQKKPPRRRTLRPIPTNRVNAMLNRFGEPGERENDSFWRHASQTENIGARPRCGRAPHSDGLRRHAAVPSGNGGGECGIDYFSQEDRRLLSLRKTWQTFFRHKRYCPRRGKCVIIIANRDFLAECGPLL